MATHSIYVVDDEDSVRNSLLTLLSIRSDLLIRTFRSGDAFLERADELEPGVLLLDYHMPGRSGMEVLREIDPRRFLAVVLTGHGSIDLALEAVRSGAADFLEKPYEPEQLLRTVDSAISTLEKDRAAMAKLEGAKAKIDRLSAREKDVLMGLIEGRSNKVIAHDLEISPRTVEIYRSNLMEKLEVKSLPEALRIAFAAGLVEIG